MSPASRAGAVNPDDHSKSVRDALSTNIVVDIGARVGYLVTRFFIPPFVLAHVGLDAYGLWATAFILVSYLGISTLGISSVYVKFFAEYSARQEYTRANALLSTGLVVTVPVCTALFALLYACLPRVIDALNVPAALRADAHEVILIVVAIFLASIGLSGFDEILTGVQKLATVQIIWTVTYLVETALIFVLVGSGRGVRGLAEAFLVRTIIKIVLSTVVAFRTLPWLRVSTALFDRESLRTLCSFGGIVQVLSLISIVLNSIERAVAAPLVGLNAAGLLDIGKKLPGMAASVPSAFATSLVPAASYLQGGLSGHPEEREKLRKLYLKGARYMNISAAYVCGLLATLPAPILDVWLGKKYAGAAAVMVIFCIATQVHLMTGPGTSLLKGIGRPREEFHYAIPNILALLLFLPAAYVFAGAWTTLGIALAVGLATVVSAAYFIRHANALLEIPGITYWRRVVGPGVVPYLLGLALSVPAAMLVAGVGRWTGAIVIAGVGAVYTAALLFAVDRLLLDQGERLWFRAVVQEKVRRFVPAGRPAQAPPAHARPAGVKEA